MGDFMLMIKNALAFNVAGDFVYNSALQLKQKFIKVMSKEQDMSKWEGESIAENIEPVDDMKKMALQCRFAARFRKLKGRTRQQVIQALIENEPDVAQKQSDGS